MRKTPLQRIVWFIPLLFSISVARGQDLSVGVYSSATTVTIGAQLTFKISVRNDAHLPVTGVQVTTVIPTGTTYVSDNSGGAYNNATGLWTIGAIGATVDSVVLNVVVQVNTDGVIFSQAEVTAMTEPDGDSTPNNGSVSEDDWNSACATVPIHYNCRDDINALASAPTGYGTYQWYKNGLPISGANKDTYRIKEIGDFNFTASTLTTNCLASLCCPITVVRDSCMSLGNLVFEDKDNNGLFNGTDIGLDNIDVQLYSAGLDGLKGTADDHLDSTTTTANGGLYLFKNLNPGLYYVKLTGGGIPENYVSSTGGGVNDYSGIGTFEPSMSGGVDNEDHGTQAGVMVTSNLATLTLNGEPTSEDGSANTNLTIDFGVYKPACGTPDISAASPAAVCAPNAINIATISVTDLAMTTGNLTYFGAASNAVDSLNPLSSTIITSSQTVWIRKTNLTGLCFDTVSVQITIHPKPVYPNNAITVCASAYVDLTTLITDYALIVNPIWRESDVSTGSTVLIPMNVTPSVSTTYFLIGENANGCKDTAEVVVMVTPKPDLGADQTLACLGNALQTTYDFATTGTWLILNQPATATASIDNAGLATDMTIAGEYIFEITVNGCKDTAAITVLDCNPTLSLGDLVFVDKNNNGFFDLLTDVGIENVEVILYNVGIDGLQNTADDRVIDTLLTDVNGNYLFTNLDEGRYFVKLNRGIPLGMVSSTGGGIYDNDGAGIFEPSISNDVNNADNGSQMGSMVVSHVIKLTYFGEPKTDGDTSSLTNLTVDFGLYKPQSLQPTLFLGNSVFNDDDNNGTQEPTEVGIPNVRVVLYTVGADGLKNTADDVKVDSVLTGFAGNYLFTDLNSGAYYVKLSSGIPTNMVSSTGQGVNDTDGEGPYEPATTGDINEADHGTQMGTMIMSDIVNLTLYDEPIDDGDTSSLTNLTVDFGLYTPRLPTATLTIGNLVWNDANNDGIHQTNEAGIKDVLVVLYNVGGDNTQGTSDDFVVTDTRTDSAGHYLFPLLSEGNYYVKLNGGTPAGMKSSTGGGVNDTGGAGTYEPSTSVDINDVDNGTVRNAIIVSNTVVLRLYSEPTNDGDLSNLTNLSVDFGLYTPQPLVCDCPSRQDVTPPILVDVPENTTLACSALIPMSTVTATDDCTPTVTPIMTQNSVSGSCAGNYVITRVWTASDLCGNSATATQTITIQDVTAPVFSNVPANITLTCGQAVPTVVDPTPTDACDVTPTVVMVQTTPTATTIVRTWTATDACGNSATVMQTITTTPCTLSLGDVVWNDTNNDGIYQNTEGGIQDVRVVLFNLGPDNTKGTADDIKLDSVLTSSTGNYVFTNLEAGRYYVKLSSGIPAGMLSSTGDGVADTDGAGIYEPSTSIDVNNVDKGTQMGTVVMSNILTLTLFGEPTNDGDTSSLTNLTVDFGLYMPVQPRLALSLGNSVWSDANNNGAKDANEMGIDGVTVVLYDVGIDGLKNTADDQFVDSLTTANGGQYEFTGLNEGKYFVKLTGTGVPTGFVSSTGGGVTDNNGVGTYEPSTSNDVDNRDNGTQMGEVIMSSIINLTYYGEPTNDGDTSSLSNLTIDFGFYLPQFITCDCASQQDLIAPTLMGVPANVTLNCQDALPNGTSVTAIDNCTPNVRVVMSDSLVRGICAGNYVITRTWTATDLCGNVASASRTLTIYDVTAPVLSNVAANITINCGAEVPPSATPTATDNCANPTITLVENRRNGACVGTYTLTRTWTATDACGNTATVSQVITVQDFTPPTLANVLLNVTVTCGHTVPTVVNPTATDACGTATVAMVQTTPTPTTIVRTWTATDACGNTATAAQTITIAPCTSSLGNLVWNDTNNDGIHQNTEGGLANVKVILYQFNGTTYLPIDSLFTTYGGAYLFNNLDSGRYYVKIPNIPTGMSSSTGDGAADTDGVGAFEPSTTTGDNRDKGTKMGTMVVSEPIILGEAKIDSTIDFGFYKLYIPVPLSLGDLVWNDDNNNGIYETNENGVPNVKVTLYAVGADGLKNTADDRVIDSVKTNNAGKYLFKDLAEGNYFVKLTDMPTGMVSSTGDGSSDTDRAGAYEPSTVGNVNNRDHGTQMGTMVMSNIVNLINNTQPTNDGDNNPNTNLTIDFGLYTPIAPNVFDLALIKKLAQRPRGNVVNNGDTVRFRMTVINQGTSNAFDVRIKDYVPKGLGFFTTLNIASKTGNVNDWNADSTLLVGNVAVGQSVTVDILLIVNHARSETFFLNKSEIIFGTNTEGSLVNTPDIDSRADTNPNNDYTGGDNATDNRNRDEDDFDYDFVVDYPDKDPIGYIYCDKTGKLLMGGTIDVQGPGIVYIIEDGSTGRYQFFTDGTPGTYTMTYSHPDGFPMSTICQVQPSALNFATSDGSAIDRDGIVNDTITIGTGEVANGFLLDKTCANNPYYTSFTSSATNEPIVLHNNIPVQCSFIGAISCKDNNYNSLFDAGDTPLDSVKMYLYDCLTNALLDSTLSIRGKYNFDGLRSGTYKVRALLPDGFRYSIPNVSGNPLLDSRLDSNGYSTCMTLNYGECDTVRGNMCFIPQIFDLALRKTLAIGQASAVNVGDTVNFKIDVFNQGSMTAYDIDVVDYMPTGLQLVDSTWRSNGTFLAKRINRPLAFGSSTSIDIKLKVTGTNNQYVNVAEISRASDRVGGANVSDVDSQADSTETNDRGGRWNVIGENDNILGGLNGDEDDADPAVISVNNVRNPCDAVLNLNFVARNFCALSETQFTATAGFASYSWDFGDGTTASNAQVTNHIYTTPTGGNYTVKLIVTAVGGCTDSVTKQVIINPMVWANAGIDKYICAGDSIQLGAQGGTHYSWLPAATLDNGDVFNPIATPSVTTTYYVFVSNDFGCSGVDSVTVFVNPKPTIVSRTGSVSTCSNGVMPIRIQINQPIASYRITGSAGYSNVIVNGSTITFDAILNGTLNNMCVYLTNTSGCTLKDTFNLYLTGNPKADFVVIEPFCNNAETTFLFTGTATPAALLTYNLDGGIIVRRSAATATRPYGDTTVVNFATFGSKLLKLTVNDGGCIDNATKSIFVRKSPKTVLANRDTTICPGVCVPLYGTAGIFDCIYQWSPPTGLSSTNAASTTACPLVTTTYTLTVIDINGCSNSASVKITVTTPPVLVGVPANATVECDAVPRAATVTAYYLGANGAQLPVPVVFNEVKTAGNCPNSYTLTRTWTATNYCNLTTTAQQIITVRDFTAPVLTGVPRNVTVSCDENLPTATGIAATDNCDATPLVTSIDVKTNGTCANNYTITRTWTAHDACNNTSTAAQVITVRDINPPMLMNVPMNMTLSCDAALPSATGVAAMDNCDAAPRVTFADVKTNGYCPQSYTLARTWTATDACGNTSTASQIMIVLDLTKPVLAGVPANVTIECNAPVPTPPTVTATDNCDPSVLRVVFAEKRTNSVCGYTLTRTWTAIDACGNAQTGVQVIAAEDRTPPSFGNAPSAVRIDCIEKLYTVSTPSVFDACDVNPTVNMVQSVSDSTCMNKKKIRRLYTAKDKCGNIQFFAQIITINDNVAPVITPRNPLLAGLSSGDTLTMNCEDIRLFQLVDATATDNCNGCIPTLTFEDLAAKRGTCPIDGFSLLMKCRWVATDCCGNTSEWVIYIKVTDNQAPILRGVPVNITVNAPSQVPTVALVTATDNCTDSVGVTFSQTLTATGNNCDYIITRTWTALDACGNSTRRSQQILVKAPPLDVKAVHTDETCAHNDGTITMIPSSGITYVWADGARGAFRTRLRAGSYTVTASVGLCEKVLTVIILDDCVCQNPVVATLTKTDATCSNNNGSATLTVDNAANYTITWSANAGTGTGLTRSNLAADNYSVTVTRANNASCSTIVSVRIDNNTANCCTPPIATVTKVDAKCSENNGTATVAVDNVADYTFTWSANATAGTGATRINLAAGTYTITVSRVNNPTCLSVVSTTIANNTEGCCNIIAQTFIVKVLQNCTDKAELCVEIAPSQLTRYTITDNGTPYAGTFGSCAAGSTLNLAAGEHQLIFTNNLIPNCKDTLAVKVVCVRQMTIQRTISLPASNEYCLTAAELGLTGLITSIVNDCPTTEQHVKITVNTTTYCVGYKSLGVGTDTACLKITTSTGDVSNLKFIVTVTPTACAKFIAQDSVIITNACTDSTKVCVNIPFDMIPDYSITLNSAAYSGSLQGCKNDTALMYNFFSVPDRGAIGLYALTNWTVNGTTFSAQNIGSMQALVDTMNRFDPIGRWLLNSADYNIVGGNLRSTYGSMKVTKTADGSFGVLDINQSIVPRATNLSVLRGRSVLVFTNLLTGCTDTVVVNAGCISAQRIENTMLIGKADTLCIDTRQLLGTRYRISTLTSSTNQYVRFSNVAGTTCLKRAALTVGTERATYVVSDEYGMNDTVYITTHVTELAILAKAPIALNDKATTTKGQPIYLDVLTNDSIYSNKGTVTIITAPKHGTAIVNADLRVLYTPDTNFCNGLTPDVFRYTICNQAGCDTADVAITVVCDKLKVFNGFSPNNDGVNDFFVIEGAETLPNNTLTIYNRWGTQILVTKGYKNDWAGTWKGQIVPDGTYFYIFNDGEGKTFNGYIHIQR